jgi:formate-dependent nitrite reductase membrane component NrfD
MDRAPYGRQSESRTGLVPLTNPLKPRSEGDASRGGPLAPYLGETYYNLAAVKSSHYGWLIFAYFFVGGLAGAAQTLSAVADVCGGGRHRRVVRAGRYLGLAGAALSPVFLISDLRTPQRWFNMVRIFRKTSPMSIGSWTLTAFGTLSGLTALGQLAEDRFGSRAGRWLARLCGVPGGAAGAVMSVYTGTLLAATSTPLWLTVPRLLPALFGASAASTASAALSLTLNAQGAPEEERRAVEHFGTVAETAEWALLESAKRAWKQAQVDEPLREEPLASALTLGAVGLGVVVPLAIHGIEALTGRRSRAASAVASVSTLAGGFLLRAAVLFAGQRSGRRPQDYFRVTQGGGREIQTPVEGESS